MVICVSYVEHIELKDIKDYAMMTTNSLPFTGQIIGTTPAIPGVLPNMFPMTPGQVNYQYKVVAHSILLNSLD